MNQISLDINKAGQIINEPVVLRVGEKNQTITVNLLKDGQPYTSFTTATFFANKPSGSIVANDPANISNGVITYTAPQALVNEFGKITNAYFLIDGKVSTESFVIAVLQGVKVSDDLNDYIPGMGNLNIIYDKWKAKLQTITNELTGIDAPKEVKNVIDNELKNYTNQINDLKGRITTAENQLNALKVPEFGTRNLIVDADELNAGIGPNVKYGPSWDNRKVIMQDVPKVGDADMFSVNMSTYATSNCYTLSFWAKSSTDNNVVKCYFYNPTTTTTYYTSQGTGGNNADGVIPITLDKNWKWYWIVWNQKPSTEYKRILIGKMNAEYSTGTMYMTSPMMVEGNQPLPYSPAPEKKVNTFDTDNWQKNKITADDGRTEKDWFANDNVDLKKELMNLPIGFHTFYAQPGVGNNPANSTGNPVRGFVHIAGKDSANCLGIGFMGSLNSDEVWSIHVQYVDGKYDDKSVVFNHLLGMNSNVKLKDSAGKETTYTITGIS